jgi:hypothetical protein
MNRRKKHPLITLHRRIKRVDDTTLLVHLSEGSRYCQYAFIRNGEFVQNRRGAIRGWEKKDRALKAYEEGRV